MRYIEPEYKVRFINPADRFDLVNLYHLARTALCAKPTNEQTRWHRLMRASAEFSRSHPDVSQAAAYKDLSNLLD